MEKYTEQKFYSLPKKSKNASTEETSPFPLIFLSFNSCPKGPRKRNDRVDRNCRLRAPDQLRVLKKLRTDFEIDVFIYILLDFLISVNESITKVRSFLELNMTGNLQDLPETLSKVEKERIWQNTLESNTGRKTKSCFIFQSQKYHVTPLIVH